MRSIILFFFCVCSCPLVCQVYNTPGAQAPQIHITDWIHNIPNDRELNEKFIVLEFWATWCGPCIKAVPHMNQLQEKFSRDDLYFISMTDESVEKVERTLRRVDFQSNVVSDQTKRTHSAFGKRDGDLPALPMTVLIDKEGVIQWIGRPDLLSEQVLHDFLSGSLKPVNHLLRSKEEREREKREQSKNLRKGKEEVRNYRDLFGNEDILYHFEFKRSESTYSSISRMHDQAFKFKGHSLPDLYGELFGLNPGQVIVPDSLVKAQFDLVYKNVQMNERALQRLEVEILNVLGLKKIMHKRQTRVWEVSIRDSSKLEETLNTRISTQSMAGDQLIIKNTDMTNLIDVLNDLSNVHFAWNGPGDGSYDFLINTASFEEIKSDLESYGLQLIEGQKMIEQTVLEFQ